MDCLKDQLSENAAKVYQSLIDFIENKDVLEEEIEKLLPELDAECVHKAMFHLSLMRRFYVAREAGWAFVVDKIRKRCLKHLPPDAEVLEDLGVVIVPDPLRTGKEAEFEACLRKHKAKFVKFAWVGW